MYTVRGITCARGLMNSCAISGMRLRSSGSAWMCGGAPLVTWLHNSPTSDQMDAIRSKDEKDRDFLKKKWKG